MQKTVKTSSFNGDKELNSAIVSGLTAYYVVARESLRKRWKKLSSKERLNEMRALVYMKNVATNPYKYLSRSATESDWYARAEKYAKEKDIKDLFYTFYIVQSPMDIVFDNSSEVLYQDLSNKYYNFLKLIQSYEYDDGNRKDVYKTEIMEASKHVCAELSSKKAKNLIKSMVLSIENAGIQRS